MEPTVESIFAAYLALSIPDQRRLRGMIARRDRDRFLVARSGLVHSYLATLSAPPQTLADWKRVRDHLATICPALLGRKWQGDVHGPGGKPVSPRALRDGYLRWRQRWEAARRAAVL